MRNYKSRHTRKRVVYGRRLEAVCPFPGRHPLRLIWSIESKNHPELDAYYFGKYTTAAWKRFVAAANAGLAKDMWLLHSFTLFDRNGEIASGSAANSRTMNAIARNRYFPFESMRQPFLTTAQPVACGPYWIYATEPPTAREIVDTTYAIATEIPTLRNR